MALAAEHCGTYMYPAETEKLSSRDTLDTGFLAYLRFFFLSCRGGDDGSKRPQTKAAIPILPNQPPPDGAETMS